MKQGWEIKKLGEVCDTGAGGTPLKAHKDYYEGGTIPWLMSGEVSQGEIFEAKNFITEKGLKNSSAKLFPINTVLVAMYGATAGQVGILKFEACTNQAVCGILPNDKTIPEYLFYCFLSKKEELVAQAVGGAQPNISQIKIRNTKITLPPLPEQQHIVSILDECFAAIDQAKANAEQNLKNAKELFESYLQGVFEKKGDGWEEKKLNEITEVKDGTHDSPKYIQEGIPFVTQKNIKPNGLSFDDTKFITETDHEKFYKRSNVTYGDILISMIGANRGMAAIVDDKRVFSIKNVGLIKSSDNINMNYLLYYLKSSLAMKYVLYMSNGGAQEFVGLTALRSFPIPLPPLKEQQTIVRQLDALRTETQKLEAVYRQKIVDLEELKKSVLAKAFAGELLSPEGARSLNDGSSPS